MAPVSDEAKKPGDTRNLGVKDRPYDALLVVSFGGPEGRDDVMPFLENVVRGKRVPRERLLEVAEHYYHFDGVSPINEQNRALIAELKKVLAEASLDFPIYWGNRNWKPSIEEALVQMRADGVRRALAFVTSAYSSYSGCRQYRENIEVARDRVGDNAPEVDKLRVFFNHPGFIEPMIERTQAALDEIPAERRASARIAFTAHSIPDSMAANCNYQKQLEEACRLVAEGVGNDRFQLVYQSRSGPPQVPWLEPDILEHMKALSVIGIDDLVIVPIGFISDHMEVLWDLDNEAKELADELGMNVIRAGTVGTHKKFVNMIRELIEERVGRSERRRSLGTLGASHDVCPVDCCKYEPRRPGPPKSAEAKPE